jgi:hypothetical protein
MDPRFTDMWLLSREKTAAYRGNAFELAVRTVVRSLPGGRAKEVPLAFTMASGGQTIAIENAGLGVDLNAYRPGVNVELLYDLGVNIFDLRLFHPGRWEYGNWQYKQDPTFEPYLNRLVKLPGATIGGYGVLNLWLDEEMGYKSPLDPNVELMKLYVKNYIDQLHYVCWDNEVYQCYKNGNPNTVITQVNHVKCLQNVMAQTLKEIKRFSDGSYRIPEHYTAMWFVRQYGGEPMKVYLNNTIPESQTGNLPFLPWIAWLPQVFNESFEKPQDLYMKLITPNGVQENSYLRLQSEVIATKWQCSWHLKGPWSPDVGIDCSITYNPRTLSGYKIAHNIPTGTKPPDDPEEPPKPPEDTELQARVAKLETWAKSVQVTPFSGL